MVEAQDVDNVCRVLAGARRPARGPRSGHGQSKGTQTQTAL